MPLHLNSITNDSQNADFLAWLLQDELNAADAVFATEDGGFIHLGKGLFDAKTGEALGRYIFTLQKNDERKALESIDLDIILDNEEDTLLEFLSKRPESSESNEYYDVVAPAQDQHLLIETVNRYCVAKEIKGTTQPVQVSAFPFELTVYEDIDAFNRAIGFGERKRVGNTDFYVDGLGSTFAAPGGVFGAKGNALYSFMVGTVKSFKEHSIRLGKQTFDVVIAQLDTAVGNLPTMMGKEVFDLANLKENCVVGMNADIKADLANYSAWKM